MAKKVLPAHVLLCQSGRGAIYTWKRGDETKITRRPYRCNCWRHEGACARREASVTFARIRDACERPELEPSGWVFFVLTLDRQGFYSGDPWTDVQRAFRELSRMSRNFLSRLRRLCARNCWEDPGNRWVSTVEAHRSGWPHVNLTIYAPELARELARRQREVLRAGLRRMGLDALELAELSRAERRERCAELPPSQRAALEELERRAILLEGDLLEAAAKRLRNTKTGKRQTMFGRQSTAERVADRGALASYMVKLAGEFDQTSGELAKLTQLPVNAFEKFRRLRAGKGFLPKRRRDETVTGTMMRRELDPARSAYGAVPLHDVKDQNMALMVERCARIEGDRIVREMLARRIARETGRDWHQIAPPAVESYALRGENFTVLGHVLTIEGERGYGMDGDGFLTWSPPRGVEEDDPPD